MMTTPLLCGALLGGVCFAAAAFTPAGDTQLSWEAIDVHRGPAGLTQAWRARTELSPQEVMSRLGPACGAFHRALRAQQNWIFMAQKGRLHCSLSLNNLNVPLGHVVLTVQESVPALSSIPTPLDGIVLWQHEQPESGAAWLVQALADWPDRLTSKGWKAGLGGSVWRRGDVVLEVQEVLHEQQRYVLVVCRACQEERP